MNRHSVSKGLIALLVLTLLTGIVGGGVMGGVVGLYAASNPAARASFPVNVQYVSSKTTTGQPGVTTNLTVNQDSAIIDTVKKAEPAVVTVINTLQANSGQQSGRRQNPLGPTNPADPNNPSGPTAPFGSGGAVAEGSGVIIDGQGHIITNNHVVDGASKLDVVFSDGTKKSARLIGADPVSDIAVLQVDGSVPAYVGFGDSNSLQLGETAIAIGSPLGNYRGSVTVGVISGLNRSVAGSGQDNLIQTDAAVNHGNSGGPLLNLSGQIVGITTLVVRDTTNGDSAEGLGFAVPASTVTMVVDQLLSQGKVQYPYIGITFGEITPNSAGQFNLPAQQGAYVQQVAPDSPASQAGLESQDVITALNGTRLDESHPLRTLLFQYHVGDTVTLSVVRNGETKDIQVTLTARPADTNTNVPG